MTFYASSHSSFESANEEEEEDEEEEEVQRDALEAVAVEALKTTVSQLTRKLAETMDALRDERERRRGAIEDAERREREREETLRELTDRLESERETRLVCESARRDAERAADDARAGSRDAVEALRRELREKKYASTSRAAADAAAYDVAEARAVAAVAVEDLKRERRRYEREWGDRELEFQNVVSGLERRLRAVTDERDAALLSLEKQKQQTSRSGRGGGGDDAAAVGLRSVMAALDQNVVVPVLPVMRVKDDEKDDENDDEETPHTLREMLRVERDSRLELSARVLDLARGRREMAKEIVDLVAVSSDGTGDRTQSLHLRQAREHRAIAESLAASLAERVDVLERRTDATKNGRLTRLTRT
jgi:hypothetical protein